MLVQLQLLKLEQSEGPVMASERPRRPRTIRAAQTLVVLGPRLRTRRSCITDQMHENERATNRITQIQLYDTKIFSIYNIFM